MDQSADVSAARPPQQFRRRPNRLSLVVVVALSVLSTLVSVVPPAAAQQDLDCVGNELRTTAEAQQSYADLCGQPYDSQSGFHRCDWATIGWICGGPGSRGGAEPPVDPNAGGPNGNGPQVPRDLAARPVTGDPDAVNPDGIRVSWTPGGGPESLGFNINRAEVGTSEDLAPLISIVGRSAFVDCNVEAGKTYRYSVSAWSEGPEFSFTSTTTEATAQVTPEKCRSLVPPGPSGENEPSTDPLFESVSRDLANRPAAPQQVKIVGSGTNARLQWEMPPSARMVFQITRSNLIEDESDELWGQFSVTPGHQDMTFSDRGDGGARFTFPVGQFSPGDHFVIQAFHPYSFTDDELGQNARFSEASRFATIINPGPGTKIPNFLESLGSAQAPSGPWIGSPDDWNPEPQFSDDFDGSGELADSPGNQWYFARNDGEREITPSYLRDQNQTDDRAILADGQLVMSAGIDDGAYSYLGSANDKGEGYLIDPTNGVFVEASVRLDQMSPADNAWWAFWLMAPGNSACDSNGDPIPGAANAYDGHAETGTEVDLFEFVPDLANGFNQAIFRYEGGQGENCQSPGEAKLAPGDRNFTYEGPRTWPEVDMPDYMDGNYHRLGLYYAQDCYAVYMDDELLWQVTEDSNPGWVTPRVRQSIRLTWEIQNSRSTPAGEINNPWTSKGGQFAKTALDRDPTVFIDYVNVWEKKESANGLCSGGPDPEQPEPEPVDSNPGLNPEAPAKPMNVLGRANGDVIELNWTRNSSGIAPDGYDIARNGEGYWTVTDSYFNDENVTAGETYTYRITPWIDTDGVRQYGAASDDIEVVASSGDGLTPNAVRNLKARRDSTGSSVFWTSIGADGFHIEIDGTYVESVADVPNPDVSTRYRYALPPDRRPRSVTIRPYVGDGDAQRVGPESSIFIPGEDPSFEPDPDGPSAAVNLAVATGSRPALTWNHGDETVRFTVYRNGVRIADTISSTTENYRYVDLTIGPDETGDFSYTIQPYYPGTGGVGSRVHGPSSTIVVRRDGGTIEINPAPVRELAAAQTPFESQIIVKWLSPEGSTTRPAGYNINRNGSYLTTVSGPPFYDDTVAFNGRYSYTVRPFYRNDSQTTDGPATSSSQVFVEPIPEHIRPKAPSRLQVVESEEQSGKAQLSWLAPVGWEQGLVDGYQIYRNGQLIAEIDEVVAQTGLPTANRVFVDIASRRLDPYVYEVRAVGTAGAHSEPSDVAFARMFNDRIESEPPLPFVRAAENVLGIDQEDEAFELGSLFYSAYILNSRTALDGSELLTYLRSRLQELNAPSSLFAGITDANWEQDQRATAVRFYANLGPVAAQSVTSILPGHKPPDMEYIDNKLDYWYVPLDWSIEQRVDHIREQSEILEANIETQEMYQIRIAAREIIFTALGTENYISPPSITLTSGELMNFRAVVKRGYSDYWTPIAPETRQLWDQATREERLEYFGIDAAAFEFIQPFIDLVVSVEENIMWSRIERDSLSMWIGAVVVVIGTIVAPQLSGFWAKATFAGFTAFTSAMITTEGDIEEALEDGLRGFLTAGLNYYSAIPDKSWWQTLTYASLNAALAGDLDDPEDLFLSVIAEKYVTDEFGLETWEKYKDYIDLVIDIAVAAFIDGEEDFGVFADRFEALLFQAMGQEIGQFVAEKLPSEWGEASKAIGDLAGHAVAVGGDEDRIQEYFYANTVPAMASTIGNSLFNHFGGENEFFASITVDLVEIGIRAGVDPNFDAGVAFEKMMYRNAAVFLSDTFKEGLVWLNDGNSNAAIDGLSDLLSIHIEYAYDPALRDEMLGQYMEDFLIEALIDLLPACASDDETIRDLADNILQTVATSENSDDFENNAVSLLEDGAWLTINYIDACGAPEPGPEPGPGPQDCDSVTAARAPMGAGSGQLRAGASVTPNLGLTIHAAIAQVAECTDAELFQQWLVGLNSIQIAAQTDIVFTQDGDQNIATAAEDFEDYQLVFLSDEPNGLIRQRTIAGGFLWTDLYVGIERNGNGDITNFTESDVDSLFDQFMDSLSAYPAAVTAINAMVSAVSGCATSVDQNIGALKDAVLEYWNADSNWAYLQQKWADINEIAGAFAEDPDGFMLFILADIVRADEYGTDRIAWAAALTCDLIFAVVTAGATAAAGKFARLLSDDGLAEVRRWQANRNRGVCDNSFPTGTLVLMADGSRLAIESVQPGDLVMAADEATGVWSRRSVIDQWSHADDGAMATVTLVDGGQVSATDDHKFWVASDGAWVGLADVEPGDFLLTPDGVTEVAGVTVSGEQRTIVWELDVAVDDTFAVHTGTSDVLVHNADCVIDATSYFPARVDTRYAGPPEGAQAFRISAMRTAANSTVYEVEGQVLKSVSDRSGFETSNYPSNADLGLPGGYDRSHLVGPGGFGQESGQILYATANFNRGFMSRVENQMQEGFAIAEANGWTMKFAITAESHPNNVNSGAVLRQIDYQAWFEKPGVDGKFPYLDAVGGQTAPASGNLGITNLDDLEVYTDFSTPTAG